MIDQQMKVDLEILNLNDDSGNDEESHYRISAFTRELIDEVARSRYSLDAWHALLSRSWERSLDDIRRSPARTTSFWSWVAVIATIGIGIILLTLWFHTLEQAVYALILWLPWYASSVFFVLIHLGMVDDGLGYPQQRLLLPNGLSFLRLGLAPLVIWPCLQAPANPVTGAVFAAFLVGLSLTDLLDGWLARRRHLQTRFGRMLDPMADLALLTFLTVGLYLSGDVPAALMLLLVIRYPVLFIGVLIVYFARGPIPLRPTLIGRATTFATSIVLLAMALKLLLPHSWPSALVTEWSLGILYFMVSINIVYLVYRAATWPWMFNEAH